MSEKSWQEQFNSTKTRIAANTKDIEELRDQIRHLEAINGELVSHFVEAKAGREELSETLYIPGTWPCLPEGNPAGSCVYDEEHDEDHYTCLFCGAPEVRR